MALRSLAGAAAIIAASVAVSAAGAFALQDPVQPGHPLAVTAVRYWSLDEATRIVVEVSGEFQHRFDRLANPARIYFDILEAKPTLGDELVHTMAVGDALVKQIRVAERLPGVTRVVLDLAQPADFSSARLVNPDRLIIEVRPLRAQPAATGANPPPSTPQAAAAKPVDEMVPVPASRGRAGSNSMVRALGLKLGRVVLDPGHGGRDYGTTGPAGLTEKDLVLDLALRLGTLIEERLGAEVVYTRKDDTFVPLEQRTALANQAEADLFLSIHANSGSTTVSGSETYYLNYTTSKSELDVAARENAGSERSIHELQSLVEKILLRDKADESREFASRIQSALHKGMVRTNARIRDRGVRRAPFVVLIGAAMPSVLSEIDFLSNPREERLLKRPDYRQKIAEALCKGLSDYASTLSRFQRAQR